MKNIFIILLLFTGAARAQITTTSGNFNDVTIGGVKVSGVSINSADSLSTVKLATPFFVREYLNRSATTLYTGYGLAGKGTTAADPLRVTVTGGVAQMTTTEINAAPKVEGVLIWNKTTKSFMYWDGKTMRAIYTTIIR